jgi:hypothetical protein
MKNKFAALGIALALSMPMAALPAAGAVAAPVQVTQSTETGIKSAGCRLTGYQYHWWNPVCWNYGWGVPGGYGGKVCYTPIYTCA